MLIVVLPAYNEEGNLGPLLDRISRTLSDQTQSGRTQSDRTYRVVVVDDGSVDATAAIAARRHSDGVVLQKNPKNMGLAETLKRGLVTAVGMAGADSDVIVTMDADNTQPPELIPSMHAAIAAGHDIVIASRYRAGAEVHGLSMPRRTLSLGASYLFRAVLPIEGVRDYTCGFRAYRAGLLRQALDRLGPDELVAERGFSCMVDILLRLRAFAPKVTEVPLVLHYDYKEGKSKMRVTRTVGATLRVMVRHRMGV